MESSGLRKTTLESYAPSAQVYLSETGSPRPYGKVRRGNALPGRSWAILLGLTVFGVAVQGYHPFAEDGGLYIAGIRKLLDPSLYPAWTNFVTEHLRFSLFAPGVADLVRATHLRLTVILLLLFLATTFATLLAAWKLAERAGAKFVGRCGAAALLACWLALPIAGTSLMLMDPYVTARSFSTPLVLFALVWALDGIAGSRRGWAGCALALIAAGALHPLMAGYGVAAVVLLAVASSSRRVVRLSGPWILGAAALLVAGLIERHAPSESAVYRQIVATRYYWFLVRWHWYELFGLVGPLAVLAALGRSRAEAAWQQLVYLGLALGAIAIVVALVFARAGMSTHFVAHLQPLRSFQIVYELMIVLLGAWLGERILAGRLWRWGMLLAVFGGVMFFVERQTFPASQHFEDPWRQPTNAWEQAFLWARNHTPKNALFALDAHYITQDGEDAQCFRALAERSALPDYSKDGGEASITPALADAWEAGENAQLGLDQEDDAVRAERVRSLGVGWVVLDRASVTAWECPFENSLVKVCRVPR